MGGRGWYIGGAGIALGGGATGRGGGNLGGWYPGPGPYGGWVTFSP